MRRGLRRMHRQDGVTFLELVISLAVFSFVIVSLVGFFLTMITASALGEAASTAFSLARACTEFLQSRGYVYVRSFVDLSNPCRDAPGLGNPITVAPLGRTYTLTAERVVGTPSGTPSPPVDVVLRASWTQRRVHTRTVATRLTEQGSPSR